MKKKKLNHLKALFVVVIAVVVWTNKNIFNMKSQLMVKKIFTDPPPPPRLFQNHRQHYFKAGLVCVILETSIDNKYTKTLEEWPITTTTTNKNKKKENKKKANA